MSDWITARAKEVLTKTDNQTLYAESGGNSFLDASSQSDAAGKPFISGEAMNGPVKAHGDNFSELVRYDFNDPDIARGLTNGDPLTLSGTDGNPLPAQPFKSENIIVMTDGHCGSTCTTLLHLLKWQGKVRSIAFGGRPAVGPQQAIGGIKGKAVQNILELLQPLNFFYTEASPEDQKRANNTKLVNIAQDGGWAYYRLKSPIDAASMSVNALNAIAEGDDTRTPLQYVYEAADCRLWWQAAHITNITTAWSLAASTAFGLNNVDPWSTCVEGSTGHPSSLSGDDKLYNNGVPVNVTTGKSPASNSNSSSSSSSESTGGNGGSGASTMYSIRSVASMVCLAVLVMAIGLL